MEVENPGNRNPLEGRYSGDVTADLEKPTPESKSQVLEETGYLEDGNWKEKKKERAQTTVHQGDPHSLSRFSTPKNLYCFWQRALPVPKRLL